MTSQLPDEDLIARTLEGDEDAFSELYERYRQPVFATAYRILHDADEALDASQEIFVKLYRSLASWNAAKSKFSTWLYRLACNHAIDLWRGRKRGGEIQLGEEEEGGLRSEYHISRPAASPLRQLEARETIAQVRHCTDILPELQRKVFALRFFQQLKLEEIAEMENCSLGTVKTSLFRATRTVRRCLRRRRSMP